MKYEVRAKETEDRIHFSISINLFYIFYFFKLRILYPRFEARCGRCLFTIEYELNVTNVIKKGPICLIFVQEHIATNEHKNRAEQLTVHSIHTGLLV